MMRQSVRKPRPVTVLVCLVIALIWLLSGGDESRIGLIDVPFLQQVEDGIDDKDPFQPPPGLSPIESLWYPWSKIIFDNRPKIDAIQVRGQASSIVPRDANPRIPYRNAVQNTANEIIQMAKDHDMIMEELHKLVAPQDVFQGYGIAMVGGDEYYGPATTTIQMIRRLGCDLPIEVFVKDPSEYENYMCNEWLPAWNARCLIITDFLEKGAHVFQVAHYQLKVLALLFSSFRHVLFLDSDSMPLVDPFAMMTSAPYTNSGLVVWPDFWAATESPVFYNIAGMLKMPDGLPKTSSESGQVLIDKQTHLSTLLLIIYYNIYGPDYYYKLLSQGAMGEGDKETFMAAAIVLNTTYYRIKSPVAAVMDSDGVKSKGRAMLQSLPADDMLYGDGTHNSGFGEGKVRPAFLHANTPKMNAGHLVTEGDLFSTLDPEQRIRLLGTRDNQLKVFGYDIEATLFGIMQTTGCEIGTKMNDWRNLDTLCDLLKDHNQALFEVE